MLGAPGEIDQLFGVPSNERAARRGVSRVGGRRSVSAADTLGKRRVADRSGPSAVAHYLQFTIPPRGGQPKLHFDIGIAGWGRSEEHTSELQSLRHLVCRLLLEKKNKH